MRKKLKAVPKAESEPEIARLLIGYPGVDYLLGGGAVPESVVLIGGPPGVGKTTLLAGISASVAQQQQQHGKARSSTKVLFISAEQTAENFQKMQPSFGTKRSGIELISNITGVDIFKFFSRVEASQPVLVVLDSLQTASGSAGFYAGERPLQQREVVNYFAALATKTKVIVFILSHTNRKGALAVQAAVPHFVDVVLYLKPHDNEICAERGLRVLDSRKNRYFHTGCAALMLLSNGVCIDPGAIHIS